MFAPGRRWFTIASITTVLVSIAHTLGNTLGGTPTDAAYVSLDAAMRAYTVPLGMGMNPSVWNIYQSLVFTMSLCLAGMGALGLALAGSADATPRLLARAAVVFAVTSAALTVLFYVDQIPPGLISMAVVTVLFAIAALTARRDRGRLPA